MIKSCGNLSSSRKWSNFRSLSQKASHLKLLARLMIKCFKKNKWVSWKLLPWKKKFLANLNIWIKRLKWLSILSILEIIRAFNHKAQQIVTEEDMKNKNKFSIRVTLLTILHLTEDLTKDKFKKPSRFLNLKHKKEAYRIFKVIESVIVSLKIFKTNI